MAYSVYKHTFPNGKVYIGITSLNPHVRWNNGNGYIDRTKDKYDQQSMANAIIEYGWDNVEHEILYENLDVETARQIEIDLISTYQSNNKEFGYNTTTGGEIISDETKMKLKESKTKDGNPNYGKQLSKEYRKKISKSKIGKHHSEDTKKRISELMKSNKNGKGKCVRCIETNVIYNSMNKAQEETGISRRQISKVCNNDGYTAGGYHWEFVETSNEK